MAIDRIPILRRLLVPYTPRPGDRSFLERAQTQRDGDLEVTVAVLDAIESRKFFGVPMARRGVQPVWLKVVNGDQTPYRLNLLTLDPNYFSPHEAASVNHFSSGKRFLGFGFLALLFWPFLWILPLKLFGAWRGNRRMDTYFQSQAFHLRPIHSGQQSEGFVFTNLDIGSKVVCVRLLGAGGAKEFTFHVAVPGLDLDYLRREFLGLGRPETTVDCDLAELQKRLAAMPRAVTNRRGSREGDPVNLLVAGQFATLLSAFGARWDETELISIATSWKTFRAFLTGWDYRYSPVSSLYLFGRQQDFALQRVRKSINERLHLRLWATPLRFRGQPVWVGQVSRDIGVRFTWRTWNLTTHRIDPDVDEARDYVVEDLLQIGRLELAGYVDGVQACQPSNPRRNLTGDPYFTDGKRAALLVSQAKTQPTFVAWT
ncbi:MAG: LssY C-terminal domain-containing protein [Pirellulales bacterium]|nr:LssY C-terminal domain-containing protein [Pirellulales bacterium]